MRKTFILILIVISLMISFPSDAKASPVVILDGVQLTFDVPPIIENNRVLVPMRSIFEALGCSVEWNQEKYTISVNRLTRDYYLAIGSINITDRENMCHYFDVAPMIVNGRTMVPLRAISELLNADVSWDGDLQCVTIKSNYAKLRFAESTYIGEMKNGLPHGEGVILFDNKCSYAGELKEGSIEGYGLFQNSEGDAYYGNFKNSIFDGKGTIVFADGSVLDGSWSQGELVSFDTSEEAGSSIQKSELNSEEIILNARTDDIEEEYIYEEEVTPGNERIGLYGMYEYGKNVYSPFPPGTKTLAARQLEAGIETSYDSLISLPRLGTIETKIDGTFEGWTGETVFMLANGQIWKQDRYAYLYHYAYRPTVIIYKEGVSYKMHVEGVDEDIYVVRLK